MYYKIVQQPFVDNYGRVFVLSFPQTNSIIYLPNGINQMNLINKKNSKQFHTFSSYTSFSQQNYFPFIHTPKVAREKIDLNQNTIKFKEQFYSFFTYKKRIPKEIVFTIHNNIAAKLNIRCVNREEWRSVNKYFKNFSKYHKEIIGYLSSLSTEERIQLQLKSHEPNNQDEKIK